MDYLRNIADIQTGPFGSQLHKEDYVENGTPIVTVEHLGNRTFTEQNLPKVSDEDKTRLKKYVLMEGDIVFSRVGSVDRCSYVDEFHAGWMFSGRCLRIRPAKEIDALYLYYYFCTESIKKFIRNIAVGATMPSINTKLMGEIEISYPDIKTQKRIGELLSVIDSKIEKNNAINKNLEQQVQAWFKEWFIASPESTEWENGTFKELIQSTLNGDWGKETPTGNYTEKVYCIRGADIPEVKAGNKGKMPTRYILPKNLVNKKLEAEDIVVEISGGSPTQSTGRCTAITQSLLDRYDSSMVCTNFCKAIKPQTGYSLFVYYYWQYLYEKGVFFSYENGTTGIKNLDFAGFIENEPILIPPLDKVQAFDDYCKSIFNQVFANGKQSEQLASLRDTLLPKLMSGELDVSDIEI